MEAEVVQTVTQKVVQVINMIILLTLYLKRCVQVVVVEVELDTVLVMVKVELEERAGHQLSYMHWKILPLMELSQQMEMMADLVYLKMITPSREYILFN